MQSLKKVYVRIYIFSIQIFKLKKIKKNTKHTNLYYSKAFYYLKNNFDKYCDNRFFSYLQIRLISIR